MKPGKKNVVPKQPDKNQREKTNQTKPIHKVMKNEVQTQFNHIAVEFLTEINEADMNPDMWYELFIIQKDRETRTVLSADTFLRIIDRFDTTIASDYGLDSIGLDIWKNKSEGENIHRSLSFGEATQTGTAPRPF